MEKLENIELENIKQIMEKVLSASIGKIELKNFLDVVVEIGSKKLEAKSCSIFLLVDGQGTLEIVAGSGDIGRKLTEAEAKYCVPERNPLSQKPEETYVYNTWEEEKKLIEEGKLGMGITAWVVKTGESVRYGGRDEFEKHPEHRGKFEKTQNEECQSIVEVPLYFKKDKNKKGRAKADGVIKVENPVNKKEFDQADKFILSILSSCVSAAIQKIEIDEPKSYKQLFNGAKLLVDIINWHEVNKDSIDGTNRALMKEISKFSKEILKWNIYGIEKMYDKIIIIIKDINKILGFKDNDCIKIIEEITRKYEEILGTGLRYREHLIHQFQVFLLGLHIINSNKRIQTAMKSYLKANGINDNFDNVIRCWFLSSIFHDFAYSIEKINDWLGEYFKTLFSSELSKEKLPFVFLWENLFTVEKYEYYKNILIKLIREKLAVPFESDEAAEIHYSFITILMSKSDMRKKNHGLFGALVLSNRLLKEKFDDPDISKIVLEGGFSIALHALDVYQDLFNVQKALLQNIPFAFLLVFCDNAQEWGRPWMNELEPGAIELDVINIADEFVEIKLICDVSKNVDVKTLANMVGGIRKYWKHEIDGVKFHLIYINKDTGATVANL
ncbi:MAG: hypothetical protein HY755_04690 [Nitrospirae bacterium]|nr:hypothetical protein [Nitrospirota bacterium]